MLKAEHRCQAPERRFASAPWTDPQPHQLAQILELDLAGARVDHKLKTKIVDPASIYMACVQFESIIQIPFRGACGELNRFDLKIPGRLCMLQVLLGNVVFIGGRLCDCGVAFALPDHVASF